ncbi:MAG: hypothetical protein QXR30_02230 [Candidatus Woesearchaeota archaeon]
MTIPIEVKKRLFENVYVCKHCKKKVRAPILKVLAGKVVCPNCGSNVLRPKKMGKTK